MEQRHRWPLPLMGQHLVEGSYNQEYRSDSGTRAVRENSRKILLSPSHTELWRATRGCRTKKWASHVGHAVRSEGLALESHTLKYMPVIICMLWTSCTEKITHSELWRHRCKEKITHSELWSATSNLFFFSPHYSIRRRVRKLSLVKCKASHSTYLREMPPTFRPQHFVSVAKFWGFLYRSHNMIHLI